MSGLTSPAASPVVPSITVAPPSVLAPGVPSLAAFLDLMIGKIVLPPAKGAPIVGARQDDAAGGKNLPEKDKEIDPALAWLFGPVPLDVPQPVTLPQGEKPPVQVTLDGPKTPITPALDTKGPTTVMPTLRPDKITPVVIEPEIALPPQPTIEGVEINPVVTPKPFDPTVMIGPVEPLPVISPIAVALPALFALGQPPLGREGRDDDMSATPTTPSVTLSQPTATPVAPTGDAQRQTLDLGRQDWPQKMIDHIEALRDNADANDTSIRLKPEALGRLDVSFKTHTDGAISVRFAAEQPTTRTLLIDAAPQLAAAAEARGIRLSGASFDLTGQGDHRPRPEVERQQNITNDLAAPRGDDNPAADDGRIA